jgi:hypothetical protein
VKPGFKPLLSNPTCNRYSKAETEDADAAGGDNMEEKGDGAAPAVEEVGGCTSLIRLFDHP